MAGYEETADKVADQFQIPRSLFRALVQTESNWNPYAIGTKGEIGLTQLMPGTATQMGVDAWNPIENLQGGAAYLKAQFTKFGDWAKALAAYNGGPGGIDLAAAKDYAAKVLGLQREIEKTNPEINKGGTAPLDDPRNPPVWQILWEMITGGSENPSPPAPRPTDQYGLPIPSQEETANFSEAVSTVGKYAGASILVIVSIGIALYVLAVRGKDAATSGAKATLS